MNGKAIDILAVSKAIKDAAAKAARSEITAGEYAVDTTVRITGTVKVGEDYTQQIVGKADVWALLAVVMNKVNGVTLESVVEEALNGGADTADLKARVDAAMMTIKGETETACKGKVTTKLNAEII